MSKLSFDGWVIPPDGNPKDQLLWYHPCARCGSKIPFGDSSCLSYWVPETDTQVFWCSHCKPSVLGHIN